MFRRGLYFGFCLAVSGLAPAFAQDLAAAITRQLKDQGFATVDVARTLLGRTRIVATRTDGEREIILNPSTGEILRDLWLPYDGSADVRVLIENRPRRSGTSASGEDGDSNSGSGSSDDGGGDADTGDDHGGSRGGGSGSSGSGSSGSGSSSGSGGSSGSSGSGGSSGSAGSSSSGGSSGKESGSGSGHSGGSDDSGDDSN